jgi:hypothetical protein
MRKRATIIAVTSACLAVVVVLGIKHAFEPPVPLERVRSIKEGMTEQEVRQILGAPTQVYPVGSAYTVAGTNYVLGGQWTYTRFLTCGYVNVLFGTNHLAEFAHYEEF